ncbi:MAG: sulfatase [Deltaproteobacteria bacterium]|nr:sulfatase [Deltaproteobacteria bacterium]
MLRRRPQDRSAALAFAALLAFLAACERGPSRTLDLAAPDALVRLTTESVAWDPSVRGGGAADAAPPIRLLTGFSAPGVEADRPGAWVIAPEATLGLTVIDPRPRRLELTIAPAPVPAGSVQTLAVRAGDRDLTARPIELRRGERVVAVDLPAEALAIGEPTLQLRFAFASRPADVEPGSGDPRTLAARVSRIRLLAADASPVSAIDGSAAAQPGAHRDEHGWRVRPPVRLTFPFAECCAERFAGDLAASGGGATDAQLSIALLRDGAPATPLVAGAPIGAKATRITAKLPRSTEALGALEVRITGSPASEVRLESPRLRLRGATPAVDAATAAAAPAPRRPPAPPKRVILVILDAASALHASAYGYARPTTPYLEQLSREGVRFERVYAPASYTIASAAAILTGFFPERTGVVAQQTKLGAEVPTIAGALHARGMRTLAVIANPNASASYGSLHDFDEIEELFRDKTKVLDPEVPRPRSMIHGTVTELALAFLNRAPEAPAFLYLHQLPPHHPYLAPPPYRGMFLGNADPATLIDTWKSISPRIRTDLVDWEKEFARDRYDEHFRYADEGVEQLVKRLAEAGFDDDTLLVVTSDHGEAFGQHERMFHNTTVYEEMVRVPLVVRPPRSWGVQPGVVIRTPVSTVDLFPTLVALASGGAAPAVDGIDLSAAILDGREPPARALTSRSIESWGRQALVDGRWKYIDDGKEGDLELYDLDADPHETRNLVAEQPVRALYLGTRLEQTLARRAATAFATGSATLDGAARETLKALGYAGD